MTDNTNNSTTEAKTEKATEAATTAVKATATKARKAATVRKARATTAKRRVTKVAAKVTAKARRANTRAVNSTRRAVKATIAAAAPQIERNTAMAYDFTKMFAGFELPAADRFQTIFAGAGERSQELVRKSQETAGEVTEIAKANLEALTEAGRIAASGVRSLSREALASSRDGFEQASASLKTLADAKSPTEFFQIQSELARASFDRVVAEGSKFAEKMVKLAGEAAQPLSNRATINAERINELAA